MKANYVCSKVVKSINDADNYLFRNDLLNYEKQFARPGKVTN